MKSMCMKKFIKRFNSLLPGLVAHDIHERHVMNLALEKNTQIVSNCSP
jgi:hypothetical protein